MSHPKYIGAYTDLVQLIDSAIAQGGAELTFADRPARTRWRQRAYVFRKLYRQTLPAGAASKYDNLQFITPEDDETKLIIRFARPNEGVVTMAPLGHRSAPAMTPEEKAAAAFIEELKGNR